MRARPDLAGAHIVVCAALESPHELRAALDAGADDALDGTLSVRSRAHDGTVGRARLPLPPAAAA